VLVSIIELAGVVGARDRDLCLGLKGGRVDSLWGKNIDDVVEREGERGISSSSEEG
jgi:hypothetical protein